MLPAPNQQSEDWQKGPWTSRRVEHPKKEDYPSPIEYEISQPSTRAELPKVRNLGSR